MGRLQEPVAGLPGDQMMGRRSNIAFEINSQTH